MDAFRPLKTKVSPTGRPAFCRGEVEVLQQDGIGFYDRETRSTYENGTLYLTTHRLLWVEAGRNAQALYLPLAHLQTYVQTWPGVWLGAAWSHPKLTLRIIKANKPGAGDRYFKVSFRKYGHDAFKMKLTAALKGRAWVQQPIGDYDTLEEAEKATSSLITLAAADARLVAPAVYDSLQGVTNLGAPGAKGVWRFECKVAGPHDVRVEFLAADVQTALSIYVNGSPSPYKLTIPPNTPTLSVVLTFDLGVNTFFVSQQVYPPMPTPPGVTKFILQPLAKGQQASPSASGPALGVSGLVKRIEHRDAQDASTLNNAFSDIDALMAMAGEVTTLLKQLEAGVVKEAQRQGGDQSEIEAQQKDLNDWMASLGLSSIVTKESVGMGNYQLEVAKQLLEFLQEPLRRQSGMLSVVDAFCIYNKARGVDLISPDDMMHACRLLPGLRGSNIRLAEVNGIQLLKLDDLAGDQRLLALLADTAAFVTPLSLSAELKLSARVCSEILSDAEQRGIVCIDAQNPQGVVYYRNLFV